MLMNIDDHSKLLNQMSGIVELCGLLQEQLSNHSAMIQNLHDQIDLLTATTNQNQNQQGTN